MDAKVLAAINMHSILRNMEDLLELDASSREILSKKDIGICFNLPGQDKLYMSFSDGHCVANRDPVKTRINLYFPNALTFNGMVDGTKNPIPTRGLTKIRFMTKTFKSLADRLTYYLKPTEESLKDQETRYISTMLTCYAVFYALSEIGNTDPQGIAC